MIINMSTHMTTDMVVSITCVFANNRGYRLHTDQVQRLELVMI